MDTIVDISENHGVNNGDVLEQVQVCELKNSYFPRRVDYIQH